MINNNMLKIVTKKNGNKFVHYSNLNNAISLINRLVEEGHICISVIAAAYHDIEKLYNIISKAENVRPVFYHYY